MIFTTPAHARAHLRSLNILLNALHSSLILFLKTMTSGIACWRRQNLVVIDLLKDLGLDQYRYPSSIPASISTSLHPGFSSTLRNLYFSGTPLFNFLEEQLGTPILKVTQKLKAIIEEFEYCYAVSRNEEYQAQKNGASTNSAEKSAGSALQPSFSFVPSDSRDTKKSEGFHSPTLKECRQRIVARIQKLDAQVSGWLRHFIHDVFGVFSFLFVCAACQFDGREMPKEEVLMTDRISQLLQSDPSYLVHAQKKKPSPERRRMGKYTSQEGETQSWEGEKNLRTSYEGKSILSHEAVPQNSGSFRPFFGSDTFNGLLEEQFNFSTPSGISQKMIVPTEVSKGSAGRSLEAQSGSGAVSMNSYSSGIEVSGGAERSGGGFLPPLGSPPNPLVFSGIAPLKEVEGPSGDFSLASQGNKISSSPIVNPLSAMQRMLSATEYAPKSMDRASLMRELECLVRRGRVAFDNSISLAFAFSRSLGKVVDVIQHEDDKFRQFGKLIQKALFSLEKFVYQDYSELQAMLPLIFIKIMCQIDEQEEGKPGVSGALKRAKTFFSRRHRNRFSRAAKNRRTIFPVRQVSSHREQERQEQKKLSEWVHRLGAPQAQRSSLNSQSRAHIMGMSGPWLDCGINYNSEGSLHLSTIELAKRRFTSEVLDDTFIEQEREKLLHGEINRINKKCQEVSASATQQTLSSRAIELAAEELQKEKLRKNITAYNVFVRNSFQTLSSVYAV